MSTSTSNCRATLSVKPISQGGFLFNCICLFSFRTLEVSREFHVCFWSKSSSKVNVLWRTDRQRSWQLAQTALSGDIANIQDGTTREGIHLGAMAGTVDLIQRCYSGIEMRSGVLTLNPRLPDEVLQMNATLRYRRHTLDVEITQDRLTISSRVMTAHPILIAYREHSRELSPGQSFTFKLVEERKIDRPARERAQERARKERIGGGPDDEAA